jgi:ribosome-binding factor A
MLMPEQRNAEHHRQRLGDAIRDEVALIVEGELGDPRIGLVNVWEVHMATDGRSARVLVSVEGDEDEAIRTIEGLTAATPFIRHEIADRLRLRHAPELRFHLVKSERYAARIDELLRRAKKRKRS